MSENYGMKVFFIDMDDCESHFIMLCCGCIEGL